MSSMARKPTPPPHTHMPRPEQERVRVPPLSPPPSEIQRERPLSVGGRDVGLHLSLCALTGCYPPPFVIPPPKVRPVPPMGGGRGRGRSPPQPQFQCNLKKIASAPSVPSVSCAFWAK